VLDERINFIEGRPLKPDEDAYYDLPTRSEEYGTLYEHCVRAIRNGLDFWPARPAPHGLWRLERRHEPRGISGQR